LFRRLISDWFHVDPASERGESPQVLDAAERSIGRPLPAALREWYAEFGRLPSVWSVQDTLLAPDQWERRDDVLTFCAENQLVVRWGIRDADWGLADPPVVVSDPQNRGKWIVENDSVSEFAIQFALTNAKWVAGPLTANGPASRRAVEVLRNEYPRLPFPDWHWPRHPTCLHGTDDVLFQFDGGYSWAWLCARSADAFDKAVAMSEAAGMDWMYLGGNE
jgi:hypothetical protein